MAMHVLASPAAVATATPDHGSHQTASTSVQVSDTVAEPASGEGHHGGHGGSGSHGGLAAMCLAVLGALVLATIGLCRVRSWLPVRLLLRGLVVPRASGTLGPAPPDLHVLCIARC